MSNRLDSGSRAFRRHRPALTLVAALLALVASSTAPAEAIAQIPEPSFTPMTVRPTLTNAPEVQQALMAEYPPPLRDAGIGGAPVVWIYIGTDGTVQSTQIAETSGFDALDQAAQEVARTMRFSPARNGDEIVAVWVQLPIRFRVVN